MSEDREHASLGGSSAHIWPNCTGSVALARTLKKEEPSKDAILGTEAHDVGEIVIEDFLNHKVHGSDPDIRAHLLCNEDEILDGAYGLRDAIWENILEQSITGKAWGVEEKVTLDKKLKMWGYVDFWAVFKDDHAKRVLAQLDYKFGYRYVEEKKNPQVAFYLVAQRKELRKAGVDIDYARGAIYQPRAPSQHPYREVRYTSKQLDTWEKRFYTAAEKIYVTGNTTLKPGSWCQFCRAKGICPAYGKEISRKASLALVDPKKNLNKLPAPERLSDIVLRNIILHKDEIVSWAKACMAYGISRERAGTPIEGLKAVQGTSRRQWPGKDSHERIGKALKKAGVKAPYKPPEKILRRITEIEKDLSKKLGKKDAQKLLSNLVVKTNPSITLVSEEDPRPKVKNALDVLSALEDDADDIEL